MAKGSEIIVSANPQGVFLEGTIYGTPKPGTVMMIKATALIGGRPVWAVYDVSADGIPGIVAVLLPDTLQGQLATAAYVTGTRCFLYCPIAGEELNMLVADVSGTGTSGTEAKAVGDVMMIDDGTGKLVDDSSGSSKPFVLLEAQTEPISADALLHCMYTGH
jgi:hypothetical protein